MDDDSLHVPERAHSVFEGKRVIVVIVCLDKAGFIWLKIFLRVEVVRVFLYFVTFRLFAVVNTLFQVVLHDVHLGDNALKTNKFIGKLTAQTSWGDKVGGKVALEVDAVVLNLTVEFGSLFSEEIAFEMVFA